MNNIEKIESLKAKLKKNDCIVLIYDDYDNGDPNEYETLTYVSHKIVERIDDEEMLILTAMDGKYKKQLDAYDVENLIKNIFIAKKALSKKIKQTESYKKPTNKKHHVGIELEFISTLSKNELAIKIAEADLEKHICLKDDGSIETDEDGDYYYAHEICILATEKNYQSIVNKLCKILRGNSAVNKTCGMHVHLDMRTRNVHNAYAALFEAQPILYAMCPKSRRTGTYSQMEKHYVRSIENQNGRYYGINKQAYEDHNTLEVRIHSGTLSAVKINNWVGLLLKIVNNKKVYARESVGTLNDLAKFKKQNKIRGKLSTYINARIEEFKNDQKDTQMPLIA